MNEERDINQIINDGTITKEIIAGKYIFWDIDGTLAPYRFNDHIADPDGSDNGISLQEINDGVFITRKPSSHMQKIITSCNAKEHIIVSHCQNKKEKDDKEIWLNDNYPLIRKRLLIPVNSSKADAIIEYCQISQIPLKNIIYVDDVLSFLREAERKGISSYHISSFLDYDI